MRRGLVLGSLIGTGLLTIAVSAYQQAPAAPSAGAVGPVGQRVFYLQARQHRRVVTLKCEKEQVKALGEYLGQLLERLTASEEAKADPSPPTWSYLLFDTHPSMAKRVAMAEAWRARTE